MPETTAPPTPAEALAKASTEFVMTLASSTLSDRDVAWEGVKALMALLTVNGDMAGIQKGVERLKKINAP